MLLAAVPGVRGATLYTDNSSTGLWSSNRWSTSASGPFGTAWVTNNDADFETDVSFSGISASGTLNIGNLTVNSNVTLTPSTGTYGTGGAVRTITVAPGKTIDFGSQSFSTAAGTGLIKSGDGVLALTGAAYTGGFTLGAGTVVARGVNAMGSGGTLTINGGTIATSATRDFTTRFTGVTIGGDFQLGALTTAVASSSSTAPMTFGNNIALGSATRTVTIGANGTYTLSGIVSSTTGTTGLTVNALSGVTGNLTLSGANTYGGGTAVTAGTLFVTGGVAGASSGTGTGPVAVNGGTFGGIGAISGAVTVNPGATIQGGTSGTQNGSLTLSSPLTLNTNGSIVQLFLGLNSHSTLATSGATFDPAQAFKFIVAPGTTIGTYTNIITGLLADPGTESNWVATSADGNFAATFALDASGTGIDLTVTSVPEPATILGGALLTAAAGWSRRRRSRSVVLG